MTSSLILTILLVFSFAVGRVLRMFQNPNFIFSGMIYLGLGLLLGGHWGFSILSDGLLVQLRPLTNLMIGSVSFLLGLRVKTLFRHKTEVIVGFFSSLFIFLLVAIGFGFATFYLLPENYSWIEIFPFKIREQSFAPKFRVNQLWFCIGVSATACSASLLNLGTATRLDESGSAIGDALRLLTKTLQVMSVLLIGVCLSMAQADRLADRLNLSIAAWIVAAILSGVFCGLLFSLFVGKESDNQRVLLASMGTLIFSCGLGTVLGISSLFVAFVTGATISLTSRFKDDLLKSLTQLEEPIFVLLLIIGGAAWKPELNILWIFPLFYFFLRLFTFSVIPGFFYGQIQDHSLSRLGHGLLGQDLMAVALALSFSQTFTDQAQLFFTTVLGSIFINDLVASTLLKRVVLDNEQKIEASALPEIEGAQ